MFKTPLLKSVITLISGSAGSQILLLITYFVLAKWYGPDSIGEVRNYTALMLTGAIFMSGGYELSLMLTKANRETAIHIRLCLQIMLAMSLVLIPLGWVFRNTIADMLNSPSFGFWAMVLPFSIIMEGLMNLLHQYLTKKEQFKQLSTSLLVYGAVFSIIAFFGSWNRLDINWLFGALVSAQFIKLLFYLKAYLKSRVQLEHISSSEIKAQAKHFSDYPKYHLASSAANYASREMTTPMLSVFFGTGVAGLFSMANQILQLPMRLVMQVIPALFYQRIAQAKEKGSIALKTEIRTAIGLLLIITAIPTLLLAIFGPWLFTNLLGDQWTASGDYVRWLAIFAVVGSVVSPLGGLVNVHFKLKSFFYFNIGLIVTRLGAIALGYVIGTAITSIALYAIAAALGGLMMLIWFLKLAGFSISKAKAQ